jgi:hypothetical protein
MKRARAEEWEETSRREVGAWAKRLERIGPVFALVYEVTEVRRDHRTGHPTAWRYRVVTGQALRTREVRHYQTIALMDAVAAGADALSAMALEKDAAHQRATSRHKAR